MKGDVDVAAAAALLAEPARTALVQAVIEDGPLPASELAARAGIAPSTASQHLGRLVGAGFLATSKSGRHRYYRLGDPAVADAIEALAIVAPQPEPRSHRRGNGTFFSTTGPSNVVTVRSSGPTARCSGSWPPTRARAARSGPLTST